MLRISIIFLLMSFYVHAQRTELPTDSFKICGKVKAERLISLAILDTFPETEIENQIIYNHRGEIKDTLKNMKGIPLKSILASTEFIYDKPKELNEFYFVFIAADGYKVVFSWNEIYNTDAGNHFYILTKINDQKVKDSSKRIAFMSTADLFSGRRYIKGLAEIRVEKVN